MIETYILLIPFYVLDFEISYEYTNCSLYMKVRQIHVSWFVAKRLDKDFKTPDSFFIVLCYRPS